MQKFLVGPGIGGAHLTWKGVKTLVFKFGMGIDLLYGFNPDMLFESYGQVGINDMFSPLLSLWWQKFHERYSDKAFGMLEDDYTLRLGYGDDDIREKIIPFIEAMQGDYAEFDEANDDCQLRVVEVPEGYQCIIVEDPEMGCETVQEAARMWPVPRDDEWRAILAVRRFCHDAEMHPEARIEDRIPYSCVGVTMMFLGDYGVARSTKGDYMFLKKNTYYKANDDHGKECFEIIGDRPNRFITERPVKDGEAVLAYAELVDLMEKRIHDF